MMPLYGRKRRSVAPYHPTSDPPMEIAKSSPWSALPISLAGIAERQFPRCWPLGYRSCPDLLRQNIHTHHLANQCLDQGQRRAPFHTCLARHCYCRPERSWYSPNHQAIDLIAKIQQYDITVRLGGPDCRRCGFEYFLSSARPPELGLAIPRYILGSPPILS